MVQLQPPSISLILRESAKREQVNSLASPANHQSISRERSPRLRFSLSLPRLSLVLYRFIPTRLLRPHRRCHPIPQLRIQLIPGVPSLYSVPLHGSISCAPCESSLLRSTFSESPWTRRLLWSKDSWCLLFPSILFFFIIWDCCEARTQALIYLHTGQQPFSGRKDGVIDDCTHVCGSRVSKWWMESRKIWPGIYMCIYRGSPMPTAAWDNKCTAPLRLTPTQGTRSNGLM